MASRKQSFVAGDGFDVLFDGSKSFWKTRSNLDILIASHKKQLCIEVVSYNAEIGVEAPRIYLSSMLLSTKINPQSEEFVSKLGAKKEAFNRQKKSYSVPELTKEVYNELMLNYIMQRLNVVSEGVDLTKELKMTIAHMNGDTVKDDDPTLVDFVINCPPSLTPVTVNYQKKASASEISRAQHKMQAENAALRNATRLAELTASATENFKLMMEEKRRIAAEMRTFSKARLRWIKAINRVLIQNYIAAVTRRLLNSSFADWYNAIVEKVAAEAAAEAEAAEMAEKAAALERESIARQRSILQANVSSKSGRMGGGDRAKNKVARRSLDNSQLPSLINTTDLASTSNESIKTPSGANAVLPSLGSPSGKTLPEKLLLDPMERRRQARQAAEPNNEEKSSKVSRIGKALSRKSFGGETEVELRSLALVTPPTMESGVSQRIALPAATTTNGLFPSATGAVAAAGTGRPPSLRESYSEKGIKLTVPLIDTTESGKGPKLLESKSVPRRARM
uniref:Uncharacterized protein n=1 Tax=Spumella elongata TaxID=89044 RepID=A0A7S3GZZ0_9STRA|mmetsp:Transcript_27943/g.47828  ORF Transcript_27943/g.47828 Transcript_27943/m.47828 type:complete len:508 (+) Transcript_27943:92-1615(+)